MGTKMVVPVAHHRPPWDADPGDRDARQGRAEQGGEQIMNRIHNEPAIARRASKGRVVTPCSRVGLLGLLCLAASSLGADWPQFRGPGGSGVSTETNLPVSWGVDKNIRWKQKLPGRGLSNPVIAGGRIFVTA